MSVLIAMKSLLQFGLVFKPGTISCAISRLSDISLPATKAPCVGDTSRGRMPFRRAHKIFETILYETAHKLIGRRSVMRVGFGFFGNKQSCVKFQSCGITPSMKNFLTSSMICGPVIVQNF